MPLIEQGEQGTFSVKVLLSPGEIFVACAMHFKKGKKRCREREREEEEEEEEEKKREERRR